MLHSHIKRILIEFTSFQVKVEHHAFLSLTLLLHQLVVVQGKANGIELVAYKSNVEGTDVVFVLLIYVKVLHYEMLCYLLGQHWLNVEVHEKEVQGVVAVFVGAVDIELFFSQSY